MDIENREQQVMHWLGRDYTIQKFDFDTEFVPRTPFLRGLEGEMPVEEMPLEDVVTMLRRHNRLQLSDDLFDLALAYIRYRDQGARLPKFSRWVTGMFRNRDDLAKMLAEAGQHNTGTEPFTLSCKPQDILRAGDTPHLYSCFKSTDGWGYMPRAICKQAPGIAILYQNDKNGDLLGRAWVHHAKIQGSNENVAVVGAYKGSMNEDRVRQFFESKGVQAYAAGYPVSAAKKKPTSVTANYFKCFSKSVHHDVNTWTMDQKIYIL